MLQPSLVTSLLQSILSRADADGVYLYVGQSRNSALELLAWAGAAPQPGLISETVPTAVERSDHKSPIVIHEAAWTDPRFRTFHEFLSHPFERLVSVPLIYGETVLGELNVCRLGTRTFSAEDSRFLFGLSLPLGALLAAGAENATLRSQVETLSQSLADRKILDRAKGILQARYSWTEEEAYLHLRRTSRQRRTPIREIATEIIAQPAAQALGARRAS